MHSTNYYCETEPSVNNANVQDNTKHIFREEDFEKVVEFSESNEEDLEDNNE